MSDRKTILIIDDEVDIVETLQDLLTEAGYYVITAKNGVEGLQRLKRITPDLIILDMNMPEMGGIAFYKEILNPRTGKPSYPVLVFTARANLEALFKDFEIDGFISKPFVIEDLYKKIAEIFEKRCGSGVEETKKNPSKKILVVEDQDAFYNKIFCKFSNHDYEVIRSRSGAEAISDVSKHSPQVILLKLKLNDSAGDVIALKFKMMPSVTDIPIILYADSDDKTDFSGAGRIYEKLGVKLLIGKNEPEELLSLSELLLKPGAKAA